MAKPTTLFNRNFLLLYQGGVVSALGDQANFIAVMLRAEQSTKSAGVVGMIAFAGGVAGLLNPLGGVLADRYPRAKLLALFDAISGVCVLTLAFLFRQLSTEHRLLIPAVITIAVIRGVCMALFYPVEAALMPDLVPSESLSRANSLIETSFRVTALIGQGLAGVLFRILGAPLLLFFDGITFLLSTVSELFIQEPAREKPPAVRAGILSELREGVRYTGRVRGFRIYLFEASCANFCLAALTVSLPFYVEDVLRFAPGWYELALISMGVEGVLKVSTDWYGYILGAMSFGAVGGGLIAGKFHTPGPQRGLLQIACLLYFSGILAPLALVRSPIVALVMLATAWVGVGFHQVILATLVQKRTPQHLRGRVFGLMAMLRNGLTPLGLAFFGFLIDAIGRDVKPVLFWAGIAGIVVLGISMTFADYRWFFTGDEHEVPLEPQA